MKSLIIIILSLMMFFTQSVKSKISEAVARQFFQECLQVTQEEIGVNNKRITSKMIESYCICNVNELDKLVNDKEYVQLMLKYQQNPNYKSREFDIILKACKKFLN